MKYLLLVFPYLLFAQTQHVEFYDNGHAKYEGKYIDEERVEKHYYYNHKGEVTKIESWEAGKLISIQNKL